MAVLEQLIEQYRSESNEDLKADIILSEFEDLEVNDKWDFLLQLINDKNTYDLVKINVYKIIEIAELSEMDLIKVKSAVLIAINNEEDELVRQWGFISLTNNFSSFHDVLDLCITTVENEEEDLDVRYSAFGVIKNSSAKEKLESFQKRLLKVEQFKKSAERFYKEMK
ncbi:HEAT repeat domain-containing protein [Pedobacter sp. ASV1-7]|jgi:hypothetical protein|uniref:HEAT repeat domain-containing protein n=1 Tax=Pedobacter sp. ASV1-7 TaxID=3145237 RepID=UPI0032E92856